MSVTFVDEIVDALLEGEVTRDRLNALYDRIYKRANQAVKQNQPCAVQKDAQGRTTCAGCKGHPKNDPEDTINRYFDTQPNDLCCKGCSHHGEKGCQGLKPLACKTWLCPSAQKNSPEAAKRLRDLARRADRIGLYQPRWDKREVMDQVGRRLPTPVGESADVSELAQFAMSLFDDEVHNDEQGVAEWPRDKHRFSDEDFGDENIQCGKCTNSARLVAQRFGGKVFGYECRNNPGAKIGVDCFGHDFAVVGDYIVDYWAKHFAGESENSVIKRGTPEAISLYGPEENWELMYDYSAANKVVEALVNADEFGDAYFSELGTAFKVVDGGIREESDEDFDTENLLYGRLRGVRKKNKAKYAVHSILFHGKPVGEFIYNIREFPDHASRLSHDEAWINRTNMADPYDPSKHEDFYAWLDAHPTISDLPEPKFTGEVEPEEFEDFEPDVPVEPMPDRVRALLRNILHGEHGVDDVVEALLGGEQQSDPRIDELAAMFDKYGYDVGGHHLRRLSEREFTVLYERLVMGRTLEEVGAAYNVGAERVRTIETKAKRRLEAILRSEYFGT